MKKNNKENEKFDDQVEGRNSVIELLESGRIKFIFQMVKNMAL